MPVDVALMLLGVTAFPIAGLGLLLWLTHLEETLPRDVRAAQRTSTPTPVLAVPVQQPTGPVQQSETSVEAGQAFSRSTRLSLGGSTNR